MKANCLSLCHFCHFGFNEINTRLQQIITCLHTRSYYSTHSLTHTHTPRSEHTRTFIVLLQNSTKGRLGTSFRHSSRVRECHERERAIKRARLPKRERAQLLLLLSMRACSCRAHQRLQLTSTPNLNPRTQL